MPEKLDPYASPAGKVVGLYGLLLFSGRKHSLKQLADTLHCSKQTVLRAIETVERSHGLAIESWMEDGQRWYRVKNPQRPPNVTLDAEAIQHLMLCRDFAWHLLPRFLQDEISRTIAQANALLPDFAERGKAEALSAESRPKGVIDYSGFQEIIQALFEAIAQRKVCRIAYRSPSAPRAKNITAAPLKLIAYREGLYVHCRLEAALENPDGGYYDPLLAVHRMKKVEATSRTFEKQAAADAEGPKTFGLMFGEPFRVRARIGPEAAAYVSERTWSADQRVTKLADGGAELEFTATSRPEVLSWILSFGPEARLLEPADLVEEARTKIQAMAAAYGGARRRTKRGPGAVTAGAAGKRGGRS